MSAANPARSQVRDAAPPVAASSRVAPPSAAAVPATAKRAAVFGFAAGDAEDQFKLNLSDIPQVPYSMDVEGLKPSLLARLVGLVARSK